jgi:hypothetical protein
VRPGHGSLVPLAAAGTASASPGGPDPSDPSLAFRLHSRPGALKRILLDFDGGAERQKGAGEGGAEAAGGGAQHLCSWAGAWIGISQGGSGAGGGDGRARLPRGYVLLVRQQQPRAHRDAPRLPPGSRPPPPGHDTVSSQWNVDKSMPLIKTPPYSVDANPAFSADELRNIITIWRAVAEDYAPWEVRAWRGRWRPLREQAGGRAGPGWFGGRPTFGSFALCGNPCWRAMEPCSSRLGSPA